MRSSAWLSSLRQDARFALRQLLRERSLTTTTVLVLALGIGATTAIYSMADVVLLHPLPYASADRLLALNDEQNGRDITPASFPEVEEWSAHARAAGLSGVGAYASASASLTGDGEPVLLSGYRISANLPRLLGITPLRGRVFRADEEPPSAERVVMLGESFWRRRFGGDPHILGRVLTLGGNPSVVVGIIPAGARLPAEFAHPSDADFWMPLRLDETIAPRGLHFLDAVGRLGPGTTLAAAQSRMAAEIASIRTGDDSKHGIRMALLGDAVMRGVRPIVALLIATVVTLLVIACANVANLLLARAAARRHELGLRVALGASRARLASQLLTESVLRALVGGALGIGLAYAAIGAAHRFLPLQLPRFADVRVDARVLAAALVISMLTGILFGLVPAVRSVRFGVAGSLRVSGRGVIGSAGRDWVRASLVVAEVALSFVLLVAAGLLLRSFDRLQQVPLGFDPQHLVSAYISLPPSAYPDSTRQVAFFDDLLARMRTVPGVQGAAITSSLPVEGGVNGGFTIEGHPFPPNEGPVAEKRIVSANYFRVLGARLIAGRTFDERDVWGAPTVMIVNESFARRWFANESAIGKRVGFDWGLDGVQTIVGVVADMKEDGLDQPPRPAMYVTFAQRAVDGAYLVVRSHSDPLTLVPAIRREVLAIDPARPIDEARTLDDVVTSGLAGTRVSTSLVTLFSAVALVLAAIGLYGVISYAVVQRTPEIGVRMALGARRGHVLALVLRQGLGLLAIGLVAGALGALAAGRLLESQLFGVHSTDGPTFAAVAMVLGAVAAIATAIPALRASRVDPLIALRDG